ncbi:MAG TPA: CehA/McbA family metallohydrolase [Candidatus Brocadiia bacterium]|nr:CehA/McbA family metallohydrolase [Candidatus Brocadiia bacterium]
MFELSGFKLVESKGNVETVLAEAASQGPGVCGGRMANAPWLWQTAAQKLSPGIAFRAAWECRYHGQRHWNYATRGVGVSLLWINQSGGVIGRDDWFRRVLRAKEWATDWEDVVVPEGAVQALFEVSASPGDPSTLYSPPSLKLQRFWYGGDDLFDGEFWARNLRLESSLPALSPGRARLFVRITNAATGSALDARVMVRNASGETFDPLDGYFYAEGRGAHPARKGAITFDVPTGDVAVEVRRGFEFLPWQWSGNLSDGESKTLDARLERAWNWPERGWLAVDHHCHLHFHSHTRYPRITLDRFMGIANGEGLNAVSMQGEWRFLRENLGKVWRDEEEDFIGAVAHEVTADFFGHLATVNIPQLLELSHPHASWPDDWEVYRQLEAMGGAAVATHPYDTAADGGPMIEQVGRADRLSVGREWVIDALLGARTCCDILSSDETQRLTEKLRDYYRLLNLGLIVGAVGCSDVYLDQGDGLPGGFRTYALAASRTMEAVAAAYRAGATFATNGPILDLKLDGLRPGSIMTIKPGREVRASLDAHSLWGIGCVELLWRGKTIKSWNLDETKRDVKFSDSKVASSPEHLPEDGAPLQSSVKNFHAETTVKPESEGWLALRVFGPSAEGLRPAWAEDSTGRLWRQFAHSGPIIVKVEGRPSPVNAEDREYLRSWILAYQKAVRDYADALLNRQDPLSPPAEDEMILRVIERSKQAMRILENMSCESME